MHDYMRVIYSVDRNVGRVLKYLEENGLMENTMAIVAILPTNEE